MVFTRKQILSRLRKAIDQGRPIIGASAGTGISAMSEETGGADLIAVYNSGRFRMAGRDPLAGCMPYGDANAILMEMANDIIPVVKNTPVLAGVCATDPFRLMKVFLRRVKEVGFSGVQNFPTVGFWDGLFRQSLEEAGMGFSLEVNMIQIAHEMDLFTSPYVFTADEAASMTEAGADMVIAHLGLTSKVVLGASKALALEEAPRRAEILCAAARSVNPDVICLCHGGAVSTPEDVEYVLMNTTAVQGFYGSSSMEKTPTEIAIKGQVERFKGIRG